MASPATARIPSLNPADWLQAALARLSQEGVEAVRVEVLARDLGVSKGSFYWHFRDRGDLLEKLLARWEEDELSWSESGESASAATRWARLIERTANSDRIRTEVAVRAWARRDERVASRVAAIERKKMSLIADVLRDVGFTYSAAESWSEMVWLVCLGWLDRATRDRQFQIAGRALGELLSEVILAASARTSALNR
ncbi:MAG TPA: TetR/AcrR family transcriptional regulator [Candidatus Acidoferrales bacterium]|nr:TetR/AcrR family transcriptional regulator [Candidatus Acidoferrales bacterium]